MSVVAAVRKLSVPPMQKPTLPIRPVISGRCRITAKAAARSPSAFGKSILFMVSSPALKPAAS